MTLSRTLMTSAIALAAATPALADLTAEQVLADQLAQMEFSGFQASATGQTRDGDALIIDGITATGVLPEGSFELTIGGATLTEQGDGTVAITYPDTIPISMTSTGTGEADFGVQMNMTQSGMRVVVSGTPEEIRYDFTADTFGFGDIQFIEPAEVAELDMDFSFSVTGMSGYGEFTGTTVRDYVADFSFDAFSAAFSGAPEEGGAFEFNMNGEGVTAKYDGRLAQQELMGSFAQVIEAGNRTEGTASHGPMTYTMKADGPDGSFEGAFAVGSGTLDFAMTEDGLAYGGTSKDMTASVGGSAIPLPPMTFKMAETGGRFAMPVVPSEDVQDFGLRMSMVGLELDQMLWGMVDPTGQLPRDPATLVIDLDGEVVLTEDIFDPAVAEEMMGPPGQINAVNINEILLTLAGAELTGDGAFTFNNESIMPMPSGVVNMMLKGGNGLLDKLVGMGLIPEEQAMGARMMMGLFARPGDGEDTLVSTIEVQEDGSVLANGQRIR